MRNLLGVAAELHANFTVSSDSYASWCRGDKGRDEDLAELRAALAAWRTPAARWERYDSAVRSVLEAAIAEWSSEGSC